MRLLLLEALVSWQGMWSAPRTWAERCNLPAFYRLAAFTLCIELTWVMYETGWIRPLAP